MEGLLAVREDPRFFAAEFIAVAVGAMDDGNAPAFAETRYIGHGIFNARCENEPFAFERSARLRGYCKTTGCFLAGYGEVIQQFHGFIGHYLFPRFCRDNSRFLPILRDEVMRMWRLRITGFAAVNDEHGA